MLLTNKKAVVDVLGRRYNVDIVPEADDPKLETMDGYTDPSIKRIVISDVHRRPDDPENVQDQDWFQRNIIRHEIIHAFAVESGCQDALWHSEDMVRWLAYMFPRLLVAFKEAGALDDQLAAVPDRNVEGCIVDEKGKFFAIDEMNYHNSVEELRKRGFIQGCHELTTE